MSHRDALRLLFPLDLGGVFEQDLALEGAQLDSAAARAKTLLSEMFGNSAYELLDAWERVYGLTPDPEDSLQMRQSRVVQKMRELGCLDRAYFMELAAGYGFTIVIQELCPFMAGWSGANDEVNLADADWCWRVYITDDPGYWFRAGESAAVEYLSYSYQGFLESLFEGLKPADTHVEFENAA